MEPHKGCTWCVGAAKEVLVLSKRVAYELALDKSYCYEHYCNATSDHIALTMDDFRLISDMVKTAGEALSKGDDLFLYDGSERFRLNYDPFENEFHFVRGMNKIVIQFGEMVRLIKKKLM